MAHRAFDTPITVEGPPREPRQMLADIRSYRQQGNVSAAGASQARS